MYRDSDGTSAYQQNAQAPVFSVLVLRLHLAPPYFVTPCVCDLLPGKMNSWNVYMAFGRITQILEEGFHSKRRALM